MLAICRLPRSHRAGNVCLSSKLQEQRCALRVKVTFLRNSCCVLFASFLEEQLYHRQRTVTLRYACFGRVAHSMLPRLLRRRGALLHLCKILCTQVFAHSTLCCCFVFHENRQQRLMVFCTRELTPQFCCKQSHLHICSH